MAVASLPPLARCSWVVPVDPALQEECRAEENKRQVSPALNEQGPCKVVHASTDIAQESLESKASASAARSLKSKLDDALAARAQEAKRHMNTILRVGFGTLCVGLVVLILRLPLGSSCVR